MVQFWSSFWVDFGVGLGAKNCSKTSPKLVQKNIKKLVIFCTCCFAILAPFWSSKAARKEPKWLWKVAQGRSPVAKTRFCAHAFGLDVSNVFGTSGLLIELQEGPGGSLDGSRKAPRRPCKSGPLLEQMFSQKCSQNRFKRGPEIPSKLVQKWSLKITPK